MYDGKHSRVPVDAGVFRSRDVVRVRRAADVALQDLRRRVLDGLARQQRQRAPSDGRTTRRRQTTTSTQRRRRVSQSTPTSLVVQVE